MSFQKECRKFLSEGFSSSQKGGYRRLKREIAGHNRGVMTNLQEYEKQNGVVLPPSPSEAGIPFPQSRVPTDPSVAIPPAAADPLKDTARIFGRSEDEMAKEFKLFKAQKLFRKFDADLTAVSSVDGLDEKISEAIALGFGSVTVLPFYAARAFAALKGKGIKVFVAVCYPFGEDLPKAKLAALKKTVELPCDGVFFPVGVSFLSGEPDRLKRTIKKAVRICRRKEMYACIECSRFGTAEIEKTVKILCKAGVKTIVTGSGYYPSEDVFLEVKTVRSALGAACTVSSAAKVSGGNELIRLFGYADRVFLRNGGKIAEEIRSSLGY